MQEIAQLTYQYDAFGEVMGMLWKRLFEDNKLAWRRVYKSLILLNNLLKIGSERVIGNAKDRLFELRQLESYKCVDERGW
jgi:epsin